MQCPHCKGSISLYNFVREKKCPACGEKLKRMPTKEQIKESLISFSEDKGYIFWSIIYFIGIWIIAFFEQIFGTGALFDYISFYKFRFIVLSIFAGSIIDYYAKANVEVTAVRNKFIFKPPRYLRAYRRWTNIFLILAFGLTAYIVFQWPELVYDPKPVPKYDVNAARNIAVFVRNINVNSILPLVTFLTAIFLCLIWSIMGLILTEDDMNDKRIRYFMQEMRVERVRYYHRASATYIGGIFVASAVFYQLVHISGLWFYIYNSRIVYNTVTFFNQYFGWVNTFID